MRNHSGAITGLALALALALLLPFLPGCQLKTASPIDGRRVSGTELQADVVTKQEAFDRDATQLDRRRQDVSADFQTRAAALKLEYTRQTAGLSADAKNHAAAVEAFNAKLELADQDLEAQAARRAKLYATLGGLARTVASGSINPADLLGSTLTLALAGFATGAYSDSKKKNKVIDRLRPAGAAAGEPPAPATAPDVAGIAGEISPAEASPPRAAA